MIEWIRGNPHRRGGGKVVWHVKTGLRPYHDEYKNGTVLEGVDVDTLCYPNGYNRADDVETVVGEVAPGKVCAVCQRKLARLQRENHKPQRRYHACPDCGEMHVIKEQQP